MNNSTSIITTGHRNRAGFESFGLFLHEEFNPDSAPDAFQLWIWVLPVAWPEMA